MGTPHEYNASGPVDYYWDLYNFDPSDYYTNFSYYAVDTISEDFIAHLGRVITSVSSVSVVVNFLLLLTVISKTVRSCSVCQYIYHLIFVTIFHTISTIVRHDYVFAHNEKSDGLCHLILFSEIWLVTTQFYSCILMDIEIIITLIPNRTSRSESTRRYFITTTAVWIGSMLFSNGVIFFGKETGFGMHTFSCFILTHEAHLVVAFIYDWIPTFIMVASVCVGSVFFIQTKINSQHYQRVAEQRANMRFKTEIFVFFMIWNLIQVLSTILSVTSHEFLSFRVAFGIDTGCLLIHCFKPVLSLILGPVREVISEVVMYVVKFFRRRSDISSTSVSYNVALDMAQTH